MKTEKDITSILAMVIIGFTFILHLVAIYKQVDTIWADNICLLIVGYYFGSSDGSKRKTRLLTQKTKISSNNN